MYFPTQMKRFPSQAKNEKVLFFSREHPLSAFGSYFLLFISLTFVFLSIYSILYFLKPNSPLNIIILIILAGLLFYYLIVKPYLQTYLIVTNKRIIKNIYINPFSKHKKEIRLDQITEVMYSKTWILENIFKFGKLKAVTKDKEATIWMKGISLPDEVAAYISRLRDFLQENPNFPYQDLKPFIPRKHRKS